MENLKYKSILLKFHDLLLEKIDPDKVLHQLIRAGVFTYRERERIKEKQTQKDKSEQLLTILAKKEPRAYEEFVKALKKYDPSLACQLLEEGRYSVG